MIAARVFGRINWLNIYGCIQWRKIIYSGKNDQQWKYLHDFGEICLRKGKYGEALDLFRKSLLINENRVPTRILDGLSFFLINIANLLQPLKSLFSLKNSSTFKDLGVVLLHINCHQASIVAFKNSLDIQKSWNAYPRDWVGLFISQKTTKVHMILSMNLLLCMNTGIHI